MNTNKTEEGEFVLFKNEKLKNLSLNELKERLSDSESLCEFIEPVSWLISNGHERLAQFIFPNLHANIEQTTSYKNLENQYKKLELEAVCKMANDKLGEGHVFRVQPDTDGHIMSPGFDDYDDNNWDYFEKILCNTFT